MGDNEDNSLTFGVHSSLLYQWPGHVWELTDVDFVTWHSLCYSHFQAHRWNMGVLLVLSPSEVLLHTMLTNCYDDEEHVCEAVIGNDVALL